MKKEFENVVITVVLVNEDIIMISGLLNNNVDGLEQDDTFMSED